MLKKVTSSILCTLLTMGAFAQTIVNTTPEHRKVILEEFTGIYCHWCPSGHAVAQTLKQDNPQDVFIINLHNSGSFSEPNNDTDPDFRTPDGELIKTFFTPGFYPSGMINRQTFSDGSPVIDRNSWTTYTNQLLAEVAYVNIGITGNIDMDTRILTVNIEAYYTANSPASSNFLTVALIQDRTYGPQSGGGAGDNYEHNHRLVDVISPTFGEEITTTTSGIVVSQSYNYTIPEMYNNVPAILEEMELVAFISETEENIINGNGAKPTYTNVAIANDASLISLENIPSPCNANDIVPTIKVRNIGQTTITSLDIHYTINDGPIQTYTYNGNITSFNFETIEIEEASYPLLEENTISITLANDDNNANNNSTGMFGLAPPTVGTVILKILTDTWAEQISWEFLDSNGDIIESAQYSGDNTGNISGDDNTLFQYVIDLPEDCITFNVVDSYGDGITAATGGYIVLIDANNFVIYEQNGDFADGFSKKFNSDGTVILNSPEEKTVHTSLYPNPANTVLNITNADNASVEVYNLLGQVMMTRANISVNETLDVANLAIGTYLVKIDKGTSVTTKKFVIAR